MCCVDILCCSRCHSHPSPISNPNTHTSSLSATHRHVGWATRRCDHSTQRVPRFGDLHGAGRARSSGAGGGHLRGTSVQCVDLCVQPSDLVPTQWFDPDYVGNRRPRCCDVGTNGGHPERHEFWVGGEWKGTLIGCLSSMVFHQWSLLGGLSSMVSPRWSLLDCLSSVVFHRLPLQPKNTHTNTHMNAHTNTHGPCSFLNSPTPFLLLLPPPFPQRPTTTWKCCFTTWTTNKLLWQRVRTF